MKKTIALIYGGIGKERDISVLSAKNLYALIDKKLFDIIKIEINSLGEWYIIDYAGSSLTPTFPVKLRGISGFIVNNDILPVDCSIPCLHGDFGEDGIIQGLLTAAKINYIGQDVYASVITNDKVYTKLAAEKLNIKTADWIYERSLNAAEACKNAERALSYPMFIKPSRLGSSFGAHAVFSKDEFMRAYDDARGYGAVLIEKFISSKYELECALFDDGERKIIPNGRIYKNKNAYDFNLKYQGSGAVATLGSDLEIDSLAIEYSNRLADFIGLTDISRIDFFVTERNEVYFNEINTFPGMTETSLYPKLLSSVGVGDFINRLISRMSKC